MDLSFLDSGTTYVYELTYDDGNGGLAVDTGTATDTDTLSKSVPDNGGFTVLLYPQDSTAPTDPSNLSSPSQSANIVELSWDAASDGETEVHHYNVYVDGSKHTEWTGTHGRIGGFAPNTTYDVAVSAVDVAGNESGTSGTISVTTASGIAEGTYRIDNVNSGKVMAVLRSGTMDGDDVIQETWDGSASQQWTVEETSMNIYRLENVNSGKVLDVNERGTSDGDNIIQWKDKTGDNQRWHLIDNGDGSHRIENLLSGKVAEVDGASTSDGATVQQWSWNQGDHQKWTFSQL